MDVSESIANYFLYSIQIERCAECGEGFLEEVTLYYHVCGEKKVRQSNQFINCHFSQGCITIDNSGEEDDDGKKLN